MQNFLLHRGDSARMSVTKDQMKARNDREKYNELGIYVHKHILAEPTLNIFLHQVQCEKSPFLPSNVPSYCGLSNAVYLLIHHNPSLQLKHHECVLCSTT